MTQYLSTGLIQFLAREFQANGFKFISSQTIEPPHSMTWHGGIERSRKFSHHAVCVIGYSGDNGLFQPAAFELKKKLHKAFRGHFFRNICFGLIIVSDNMVENDQLKNAVYHAEKLSTALIHWIIFLPHNSGSVKIAHTYSEVSTTFMIDEILDSLKIPINDREIIIAEPTSPFKMKLF